MAAILDALNYFIRLKGEPKCGDPSPLHEPLRCALMPGHPGPHQAVSIHHHRPAERPRWCLALWGDA